MGKKIRNCKTLANKIVAIILVLACLIPIFFMDGDATPLVFFGMIAVMLWREKENVIDL